MTQAQATLGTTIRPGIFIVEDEAVVAEHIERTLLDLGYRVLGRTGNGSDVVRQVMRLRPDLVLMDIGLPGEVDGLAAAAAIRTESSIPVVFLTGLSDVETLERAGISGPFGYVVKPFRQADLLGAIEIALHRGRTEAVARERESLLLMTLQSIGDGVVTTNEKEEVTFLNPAAERMTGWSLAEASGRPLAEVMPMRNESTGESVAPLRQVLDERRTTHLPKGTLLVGRSETLPIGDSAAPIVAEEATLLGAVMVVRDASEQQRLEEQLRRYQKMEVIGQLTSGIAHDFNSILSAILLYSRLLAASLAEDDPRRQDAEEIEKAGKRGAVLTRQLLTFGQRQALDPAVLHLNEVVAELQHMLRRLLAAGIEFSFDGASDLGSITVDRGQIEQVIVNLVVNARDAMPRGGTLQIETHNVQLARSDVASFRNLQPGPHVMLVIRDSGCGMDAETQRHAFEPFFTTKE